MSEMRTAARDVIGYVHKGDGEAYEFWRAHAIAFAREWLREHPEAAPPGEHVQAADALSESLARMEGR